MANDVVNTARAFNTDITACGIDPQKAHELINALIAEVEALRRGEFICGRCHHRKDAEVGEVEF